MSSHWKRFHVLQVDFSATRNGEKELKMDGSEFGLK